MRLSSSLKPPRAAIHAGAGIRIKVVEPS